jgi:nucleotide-binding universal stress UspA family protein
MTAARFARITVAIDGSPSSEDALAAAIDLARTYKGELTVLTVAPLVPVYLPSTDPFVPATVTETEVKRYRKLVDSAVAQAQDAGVASVTGLCREGVVFDEIISQLETDPTDVVVVGSRGLSAAQRLLVGSISGALVAHAPCPVLVVRARAPTKPAR